MYKKHTKMAFFALLFILLFNFASLALESSGVSLFLIMVIFYPFCEELLKLFIAIKLRNIIYNFIIIFALVEFFLVKIPMIMHSLQPKLDFSLSIMAIIFHIATAVVYNSRIFWGHKRPIFLFILSSHILYNATPDLDISFSNRIAIPIFICCALFLVGRHGDSRGFNLKRNTPEQ